MHKHAYTYSCAYADIHLHLRILVQKEVFIGSCTYTTSHMTM